MYDVFFLTYDEPNADQYWETLKELHPVSRRVHGIKGIQNAHAHCASLARTRHFFVVDGDNQVIDSTAFRYRVPGHDSGYVHLWNARNPVNDLTYGWAGIKLFPKILFDNAAPMRLDMTTGFPLKLMTEVASVTHFNVSEFATWRSAFRECVKLSIAASEEAQERLSVWCGTASGPYAEWCLSGALAGRQYGIENALDHDALVLINDYDWLRGQFETATIE